MKAASRKGFTLIEILIVVIILGILAAIVIPQFANASQDAKLNAVRSTVQSVRGQIGLYALQHGDTVPTATNLWAQLTTKSTFDGKTWGPYLQSTPSNPFNQLTGVGADSTGTNGWYFDTTNGSNKFFGYTSLSGGSVSWVGDN